MALAKLCDKNGLSVDVIKISGKDAYAYALEAYPSAIRRLRLCASEALASQDGRFVHGLAALREECAGRGVDNSKFPPSGEWHATVRLPAWDGRRFGHFVLDIYWYCPNHSSDVLGVLEGIVAEIDFAALARFEEWED